MGYHEVLHYDPFSIIEALFKGINSLSRCHCYTFSDSSKMEAL